MSNQPPQDDARARSDSEQTDAAECEGISPVPDTPVVHQSNDVSGGLPRSPGNSGPRADNPGWQPAQSVDAETNPVHESNDLGGGLPKSPAGANRLAGDRKMDDDTGFSRG